MAQSIKERCCLALFAKLQAIGGITGLKVERNRAAPVEEFPTIVQYDMGASDELVEWMGPAAEWRRFQVDVDCFVVADEGGADRDLAAMEAEREAKGDALYVAALGALLADTTLGGVAIDVQHERGVDALAQGRGSAPGARKMITLAVEYCCRSADPTAFGP